MYSGNNSTGNYGPLLSVILGILGILLGYGGAFFIGPLLGIIGVVFARLSFRNQQVNDLGKVGQILSIIAIVVSMASCFNYYG